ncbi:MAG: trehalase family glycosidase [Pseudomonadota bacterium]
MYSEENISSSAQKVLRDNTIDECYTVPTRLLYPFQWNWDSCFILLGWITFDEQRAWTEIETLLKGQCHTGKIPHILFHHASDTYFPGPDIWEYGSEIATSGITQPPVLATCIRLAYEFCKNKDLARQYIEKFIPQIIQYHRWYHTKRDPNNTGLIASFHPWETGRDNSVEWDDPLKRVPLEDLIPYERKDLEHIDPAYRPSKDDYDAYFALLKEFKKSNYDQEKLYKISSFKIADIGINSILYRANKDLIFLLETFDQFEDYLPEIKGYLDIQSQAFEKFYSNQTHLYHSIDLVDNKHLLDKTAASFLPLWAHSISQEKASLLKKEFDIWISKSSYLVPSLDLSSEKFSDEKYWRGPIWPILNFMIAKGFEQYGFANVEETIKKQSSELIKSCYFKEYYNPKTGEGIGGDKFSWTAAMWLYWVQN